ncbi:ankyrin repeat domain-containing protein [Gimesia panareensis]|uniref:ankyrin repeat domain-containing protein n=1 Tax=Gimesia panareensis TaxID=2527978 RepID=UPI00118868F5|nr:ankyrin repeat domain-containing protein [Gimesia panareensis]QDU50901.1 Ankyrin repeats (3 copies) [Gimesia panareensis]
MFLDRLLTRCVALVLSTLFSFAACNLLLAQEDSTPVEKAPGEELPDLEARLKQSPAMQPKAGDKDLSLHELIRKNRYATLLGRLREGADPNSTDAQGQTPLHVAVEESKATIALLLIDHGATLNQKDSQNRSPLDVARQNFTEEGANNMISLLQKREALVKAGKNKVARPPKTRPVSVWLKPLKEHHAAIKKVNDRFRLLGAMQNPPPKKDVKTQGEQLIEVTQSACAFLDQYSNTRRGPRRGLQEELELVRQMRAMVQRSTMILQQLSQLQMPQDQDPGYKKRTESIAREAVLLLLQEKVDDQLDREGLGAFIKEDHLGLIREQSARQLEKSMKAYLDEQLQQSVGIRLNDLKSLKAAARAKVRHEINEQVARLVLEISSQKLLIRFAQDVVLELLEEKLWPLIREGLRPKGNLEARTYASIATLEESYEELAALSNSDPTSLDLSEARKVLRRAEGRKKAMKYLLKDAQKAGEEDLLLDLELARETLDTRYNIVAWQFMLREDNNVAEQVADENTIMKGLLEIARYLVGHMSGPKLVLQGAAYPQTVSSFSITPTVMFEDQKEGQQEQSRIPGLKVTRSRHYKLWEKEYVVRSRFSGRDIYSYRLWRPLRSGQMSSIVGNNAYFCGVAPGKHQIQARVVTLDGEVYDFEYELEVKSDSERLQKELQYAHNKIRKVRKQFTQADSLKEKVSVAESYWKVMRNAAVQYMRSGGEKSSNTQRYLDECNAVASYLLKGEQDEDRTREVQYIEAMASMCHVCAYMGTPEAFEKAKQYTAQAEKVQSRPGLRKTTEMASCYAALKNMSVAIFNDVSQGRRYHEKQIQAQLDAGVKLVDLKWLYANFPRQIKVPEKVREISPRE